jgi:hypothetical protein
MAGLQLVSVKVDFKGDGGEFIQVNGFFAMFSRAVDTDGRCRAAQIRNIGQRSRGFAAGIGERRG